MIGRVPPRLRAFAFGMYAGLLFVATHWPRLEIKVPSVERPDLFIHFAIFAVWTLLLWASRLSGPLARGSTLWRTWIIAAGYAALDEASQLLPVVQRHAAWDDLAANIGGVTIGAAFAAALVRAGLAGKP